MKYRLSALLLPPLVWAIACSTAPQEEAGGQALAPSIAPAIDARASVILDRARMHEPGLTRELQDITHRNQVRLHGLEHRLKTRASLTRKIRTLLSKGPDKRTAEEIRRVVIDDALRYTILIEDKPPGHYSRTAKKLLSLLEAAGHKVIQVKNYWPRGDSYAGLNCVLVFPDGFRWELQFHTEKSLVAIREGHKLYEILRLPGTSLDRKRSIFDRLTTQWNSVPIPKGILLPHSVHPKEALRLYARPKSKQ